MIKKTFIHIEGISYSTEKLLHDKGILSWEEFLEQTEKIDFISEGKIQTIKTEIYESLEMLEKNNLEFFREKLPNKEHHRLINYGKIGFLDIETTGLSRWTDDITLIGIYDEEGHHLFIKGENLDEAKNKIKEYDIIVTFYGKRFDMPFIEYKFKEKYNVIHLDLRDMLKEFGYSGGLKKIEREFNISRDSEVEGIDGREAVRLWRKYERGDLEALDLLKKYNYEDVYNLKILLNWYLEQKSLE